MKNTGITILFSITYFFLSCGNEANKQYKKEKIFSVNKLNPAPEKRSKKFH